MSASTAPETTPPALHPQQARAIAAAEGGVSLAQRALRKAKKLREEVRARYRPRVPKGELITVGGYEITRSDKSTGPSFSIAGYLEHHELTPEMRPYYKPPSTYEDWQVRSPDPDPS